jgi:transglutaminase-like putative cysteine protease
MGASALAVLLAASPLSRDYNTLAYLPELIFVIIVAFACGWLSRRLDVPTALAPAVAFIGLVEALTLMYFREAAFAGFLPTPAVFAAAGKSVRAAFHDIYSLASPIEPNPQIVMLTASGVFAVAVMVDMIVFRSRHPVAAGLPLLALFIIPASLSKTGAGWLNFSLAAGGYLALLTAEGRERVRRWGRRLDPERAGIGLGDSAPILRVARSIGGVAIGLALVVPGLLPGLGHGWLTGRGNSISGTGTGDGDGDGRGLVNPMASLQTTIRSNKVNEIIRVYTDSEPEYLRQTALDRFDGTAWTMGYPRDKNQPDAKQDIPLPPGMAAGTKTTTYTARIQISDRNGSGSFLPVPYSPVKIGDLDGTWRYHEASRTFFSPSQNTRGSSYTVEAVVPAPHPAAVSESRAYPSDVREQTVLTPAAADPLVRRTALSVTRDADTPWEQVVALERYFSRTGGFVYDLNAPSGSSRDAMRRFLTNKIGYCEQYAGAMAAMARSLGLPARVVVGYTTGTRKDGYWSITNRDAHAWPEIYFVDAGWVRFEPTPPSGGEGVRQPDYSAETPDEPTAEPTADVSAGAAPTPFNDPRLRDPGARGATPSTGFDEPADSGAPRWLFLVLLGLVIAPVLPAGLRGVRRRWQRSHADGDAERANVAWRHLEDDAADLGFTWPSSSSPRSAARSLVEQAELSGEPADAVQRLGRAEELARYSAAPRTSDGLYDDVAAVRRAMLQRASRRDRLIAMLLPASARRQTMTALTDAYVRVRRASDSMRLRLRRRLPRPART